MATNKLNFIFFGTPDFSRDVLDTLKSHGFLPSLIITQEDKPAGRKMLMTPSCVKVWGIEHTIPVLQPTSLKDATVHEQINSHGAFDVAVVASYGKIIPQDIIDLPKKGTLNIHPSLLPRHRGASPIHSTILECDSFGVTIIRLDALMDHGPIVAQKEIPQDVLAREAYRDVAEKVLAKEGALLLSSLLTQLETENLPGIPQDESKATFCKKIQKSDGKVNLETDDPSLIVRKVRAFVGWPSTFFTTIYNGTEIRVQIIKAHLQDGMLAIESVKPEGKKEVSYADFLRGKHS